MKKGPPKEEVDMQSVHARASFVRVGRASIGSIWDSILESFGSPVGHYTLCGSPLGQNKGAKVRTNKTVLKQIRKRYQKEPNGLNMEQKRSQK